MNPKKIHIGKWIESVINEKHISQSELSKRINTSRQNMGRILKKDTLDVKQLFAICQALDYDFFSVFSPEKKKEEKTKVILQIEIDEDKISEVLKHIDNNNLYNILKE